MFGGVLRRFFGEEPGKQTEASCKAWEFSRSRAQETSGTKGETAIQSGICDGKWLHVGSERVPACYQRATNVTPPHVFDRFAPSRTLDKH
jgi:hypothetical protein